MGSLQKQHPAGLERLTKNQISFYEFFTDTENEETFRNATASYEASTYSCEGWSRADIRREAHRVRHNPKVAPLIESRLTEFYRMSQMSADEALTRQSELGRFDLGDIIDVQEETCACCGRVEGHVVVNIKRAKELGLTRFLKKVSYDRQGRQIYEFHDAVQAQDKILKAAGAYQPKVSMGATDLMSAMMAAKAAMEREDPDAIDTDYEVVDE